MAENRIGWRARSERESEFRRALAELRALPRDGLDRGYEPILSRSSIARFLDLTWEGREGKEGKVNSYSDDLKDKLIYCIESPKIIKLYDSIASRMQSPSERSVIVEKFIGSYTYFSPFFLNGKTIYPAGHIEVFLDVDENPSFLHRSWNWEEDEPEHVGFVYKADAHLFLVGTKIGSIKSMIIRAVPDPKIGHMVGLNLSVKASDPLNPFATRFVIISNQNTKMIAKFSDAADVEKIFNETVGGQSPNSIWL